MMDYLLQTHVMGDDVSLRLWGHGGTRQFIAITNFIPHPEFNKTSAMANDIAVIRVGKLMA